ncbi:MAG TPA: ArsA-related P-loop ATPase [Candidatus Binataceae bacterium]|jgi:anion-transporting  ArsA/GET3 family ATPase|nr:ArsA-related P-loop ATPase [Candidatus Binataceae bacterium]
MSTAGSVSDLLAARLLVCLGPGGVGKTTMSATLALRAALGGRRVDVMTVDPAPRLLDALGVDPRHAAEPREVALEEARAEAGAAARSARRRPARRAGRLRALRLDPKHTFDALVTRHAPSPAAAQAILHNRIYGNLSQALAGVGDYMAMERLLELSDQPSTDLVVLDTPPAREALDFLDAPRRLLELLNSRAVSLLGGGMRRGLGVVDLAARAVLAAFDRITGLHLLGDVQTFVRSFDGMYAGFAERAARAQMLLVAADTAVVVVTTAEPERIDQAHEFIAALSAAGIATRAVIVNRTLPAMPVAEEIARAAVGPALRRKLARAAHEFAALKERETAALVSLRAGVPAEMRLFAAPDLGTEPASLGDLARLGHNIAEL